MKWGERTLWHRYHVRFEHQCHQRRPVFLKRTLGMPGKGGTPPTRRIRQFQRVYLGRPDAGAQRRAAHE